jgi:hypothetical protein
MKVLCNLTTKKIEGFSRWDDIPFNPETHIVLDVNEVPNMENQRLNDTNDGLRPINQAEIDAEDEENKDYLISQQLNSGARNIEKAVTLTILEEINALRAKHALPEITITQFKNAVKAKL